MCLMPRRRDAAVRPVVAYPWVFYSVPYAVKGSWIRTDICTAQVACPEEHCLSDVMEPCKAAEGIWTGGTHLRRRQVAQAVPRVPGTVVHINTPGGLGFTITNLER